MPATSSRRRRRRRHRGRRRSGGGGFSERDWTELPHDALLVVFGKLDHFDVLAGAGQVCRSWRRAARDEPSLYRRIHIHDHRADRIQGRNSFARAIIRRAAGQCEAFSVWFVGDDRLLRFVADQAPSLKSLHLRWCIISSEGFAEAIRRLPLLEDLELTSCPGLVGKELFETAGQSCPRLKHLMWNYFHVALLRPQHRDDKDQEAHGIATMTELHSLKIVGNLLTMKGLETILDSCPHLESLDLVGCVDIKMDDVLRKKCAGFKKLWLHEDHILRKEAE